MTTDPMPLMLDDSIAGIGGGIGVDLDGVDLFGDPVTGDHVGIPMPARPPSKQLQQRIDELRGRGCCQTIAWSRQGTIASVSRDGTSVELRFLRCKPENGTWELSEASPCPPFAHSGNGGPITHLAWAATGSPELAIIDAAGRVTILSFSITLNYPYMVRRAEVDYSVDDLHAIVGCYWLPLMPPGRQYNAFYGPAVLEGSQYRYENSGVSAFGPWHPNPAKSALFCVTTNGMLKLFYSQNSNTVEETSVELESVASSDDLITHASMCSEKGTLLMALATASKQLKIVQTAVAWGTQPDKQMPPAGMPLSPSFKEEKIAVASWFQPDPSSSPLDISMAQLSHVEILPTILDNASQSWQPRAGPLVITVRSYVPVVNTPYNQESYSIIDRWEILYDQAQAVHPAFEQLGSRSGGGSSLKKATNLHRLDPIVIDKVVISLQVMQLGKIICFAFSDGTVQYRDRLTMDEVYSEPDFGRIMSLNQVGFRPSDETPCTQVAFSPSNCSFVQVGEDGKVTWNGMQYNDGEDGSTPQDNQYAALIAGLTVSIGNTAIQQINYDDILAIARPVAKKPRFAYDWIMEIIRMLKVAVDYSEEAHHDQLVRNSHLHLCLSVLNHLGFSGEFQPRSFGGNFSMLALNVRNIVILITIASNTPANLKDKLSPLDESEVVNALAGCAKYALDLLAWLTDSLFELLTEPKFQEIITNPQRFSEMTAYLQAKNDVSLHLLLCSSTRGFLSAACRRLAHLDALSKRAIQYYESKAVGPNAVTRQPTALYHAYQRMQKFTSSSLIKVPEFDKLLSTLGNDIRTAYHTNFSALGQGARPDQQQAQMRRAKMHCELGMLLATNPPGSLREVVEKLFNTDLRQFRAQTDPAQLYFADYALIEAENDAKSLAEKKRDGRYYDVFKRVELRKASGGSGGGANGAGSGQDGAGGGEDGDGGQAQGPLWRRCVRCASVMEEVSPARPGFTFVLAQQRKCSCGGSWGLLLNQRGAAVSGGN